MAATDGIGMKRANRAPRGADTAPAGSLVASLAAAGATLLSAVAPGPLAAAGGFHDPRDFGEWDVKASLLYYAEGDSRVQALEPSITATRALDTDESLTFQLTLDALTGASPNGAVPSATVQTFTRPSGNGYYTADAGERPLDDTFRDTRLQASANWTQPLASDWTLGLGARVSNEYDYRSLGLNSQISRDLNQKNTTLSLGVSVSADNISPEGGIPVPFALMQPGERDEDEPENEIEIEDEDDGTRLAADDDRLTVDLVAGLAQVIDRRSLFQVNLSLSLSDGYHTDPFKVLSVVDDEGNPTLLDPAASGDSISAVRYEHRPDTRARTSLFALYKRKDDPGTFSASLRLADDDWGVQSLTTEFRYRWRWSPSLYLQPRFRYYQQGRADFYTPFLREDDTLPTFASADYRLADMQTMTLSFGIGNDNARVPWAVALEYYLQTVDEPEEKFGALAEQELNPDTQALMLRLEYDY